MRAGQGFPVRASRRGAIAERTLTHKVTGRDHLTRGDSQRGPARRATAMPLRLRFALRFLSPVAHARTPRAAAGGLNADARTAFRSLQRSRLNVTVVEVTGAVVSPVITQSEKLLGRLLTFRANSAQCVFC